MEFLINTDELQRIVKLLGSTAKINDLGIAGRVLIEAYEDNTALFLSNNGTLVSSIIAKDVIVKECGATAISYGMFKSFVLPFTPWNNTYGAKNFIFTSDEVSAQLKVDNIYDNGKKSKAKLKLDVFDPLSIRKPKSFDKPTFVLNSNIFKTAVSKVLYAINPGDSRGFIRGMNIRFDNDYIYFAGTNGQVLSEYKIKNISELTEGSFIIDHGFFMALKNAIFEEVSLNFELNTAKTNANIKVKFGNVCLYGALDIGAAYPDYSKSLNSFEKSIKLDKNILLGGLVSIVDLLNTDDYNRLTMVIQNKKISMYNDIAKFDYDWEVDVDGDLIIDVNGELLLQTIFAIKDDSLFMKFSDDLHALIFDSANFEDQKGLIMPIRRR